MAELGPNPNLPQSANTSVFSAPGAKETLKVSPPHVQIPGNLPEHVSRWLQQTLETRDKLIASAVTKLQSPVEAVHKQLRGLLKAQDDASTKVASRYSKFGDKLVKQLEKIEKAVRGVGSNESGGGGGGGGSLLKLLGNLALKGGAFGLGFLAENLLSPKDKDKNAPGENTEHGGLTSWLSNLFGGKGEKAPAAQAPGQVGAPPSGGQPTPVPVESLNPKVFEHPEAPEVPQGPDIHQTHTENQDSKRKLTEAFRSSFDLLNKTADDVSKRVENKLADPDFSNIEETANQVVKNALGGLIDKLKSGISSLFGVFSTKAEAAEGKPPSSATATPTTATPTTAAPPSPATPTDNTPAATGPTSAATGTGSAPTSAPTGDTTPSAQPDAANPSAGPPSPAATPPESPLQGPSAPEEPVPELPDWLRKLGVTQKINPDGSSSVSVPSKAIAAGVTQEHLKPYIKKAKLKSPQRDKQGNLEGAPPPPKPDNLPKPPSLSQIPGGVAHGLTGGSSGGGDTSAGGGGIPGGGGGGSRGGGSSGGGSSAPRGSTPAPSAPAPTPSTPTPSTPSTAAPGGSAPAPASGSDSSAGPSPSAAPSSPAPSSSAGGGGPTAQPVTPPSSAPSPAATPSPSTIPVPGSAPSTPTPVATPPGAMTMPPGTSGSPPAPTPAPGDKPAAPTPGLTAQPPTANQPVTPQSPAPSAAATPSSPTIPAPSTVPTTPTPPVAQPPGAMAMPPGASGETPSPQAPAAPTTAGPDTSSPTAQPPTANQPAVPQSPAPSAAAIPAPPTIPVPGITPTTPPPVASAPGAMVMPPESPTTPPTSAPQAPTPSIPLPPATPAPAPGSTAQPPTANQPITPESPAPSAAAIPAPPTIPVPGPANATSPAVGAPGAMTMPGGTPAPVQPTQTAPTSPLITRRQDLPGFGTPDGQGRIFGTPNVGARPRLEGSGNTGGGPESAPSAPTPTPAPATAVPSAQPGQNRVLQQYDSQIAAAEASGDTARANDLRGLRDIYTAQNPQAASAPSTTPNVAPISAAPQVTAPSIPQSPPPPPPPAPSPFDFGSRSQTTPQTGRADFGQGISPLPPVGVTPTIPQTPAAATPTIPQGAGRPDLHDNLNRLDDEIFKANSEGDTAKAQALIKERDDLARGEINRQYDQGIAQAEQQDNPASFSLKNLRDKYNNPTEPSLSVPAPGPFDFSQRPTQPMAPPSVLGQEVTPLPAAGSTPSPISPPSSPDDDFAKQAQAFNQRMQEDYNYNQKYAGPMDISPEDRRRAFEQMAPEDRQAIERDAPLQRILQGGKSSSESEPVPSVRGEGINLDSKNEQFEDYSRAKSGVDEDSDAQEVFKQNDPSNPQSLPPEYRGALEPPRVILPESSPQTPLPQGDQDLPPEYRPDKPFEVQAQRAGSVPGPFDFSQAPTQPAAGPRVLGQEVTPAVPPLPTPKPFDFSQAQTQSMAPPQVLGQEVTPLPQQVGQAPAITVPGQSAPSGISPTFTPGQFGPGSPPLSLAPASPPLPTSTTVTNLPSSPAITNQPPSPMQGGPGPQIPQLDYGGRVTPQTYIGAEGYAGRQQPVDYAPTYTTSATGATPQQYQAFREGVAGIEDSNYNQFGGAHRIKPEGRYAGRYQMGGDEIASVARSLGETPPVETYRNKQTGRTTTIANQQFLNDGAMQERYFDKLVAMNDSYLNQVSPKYRNASTEEKLEYLGYAHNQGGPNTANYLATGKVTSDANKTPGTRYSNAVAGRLSALDAGQGTATPQATGPSTPFTGALPTLAQGQQFQEQLPESRGAFLDPKVSGVTPEAPTSESPRSDRVAEVTAPLDQGGDERLTGEQQPTGREWQEALADVEKNPDPYSSMPNLFTYPNQSAEDNEGISNWQSAKPGSSLDTGDRFKSINKEDTLRDIAKDPTIAAGLQYIGGEKNVVDYNDSRARPLADWSRADRGSGLPLGGITVPADHPSGVGPLIAYNPLASPTEARETLQHEATHAASTQFLVNEFQNLPGSQQAVLSNILNDKTPFTPKEEARQRLLDVERRGPISDDRLGQTLEDYKYAREYTQGPGVNPEDSQTERSRMLEAREKNLTTWNNMMQDYFKEHPASTQMSPSDSPTSASRGLDGDLRREIYDHAHDHTTPTTAGTTADGTVTNLEAGGPTAEPPRSDRVAEVATPLAGGTDERLTTEQRQAALTPPAVETAPTSAALPLMSPTSSMEPSTDPSSIPPRDVDRAVRAFTHPETGEYDYSKLWRSTGRYEALGSFSPNVEDRRGPLQSWDPATRLFTQQMAQSSDPQVQEEVEKRIKPPRPPMEFGDEELQKTMDEERAKLTEPPTTNQLMRGEAYNQHLSNYFQSLGTGQEPEASKGFAEDIERDPFKTTKDPIPYEPWKENPLPNPDTAVSRSNREILDYDRPKNIPTSSAPLLSPDKAPTSAAGALGDDASKSAQNQDIGTPTTAGISTDGTASNLDEEGPTAKSQDSPVEKSSKLEDDGATPEPEKSAAENNNKLGGDEDTSEPEKAAVEKDKGLGDDSEDTPESEKSAVEKSSNLNDESADGENTAKAGAPEASDVKDVSSEDAAELKSKPDSPDPVTSGARDNISMAEDAKYDEQEDDTMNKGPSLKDIPSSSKSGKLWLINSSDSA